MHIFPSGIPFNFFPIFSLVDLYFTRITLSPPLIKSFYLLILIVHSIIPYWLWEASHLHTWLYKEPSPSHFDIQIYMVIAIHTLYAIVMLQVWRAIFGERVWILKLFVENFYLLVFSSHASMTSNYYISSMHFHIILDLIFAFID